MADQHSALYVRDRLSFFYVERGSLSVVDGCLVMQDNQNNIMREVPSRATCTILVGPGSSVTTEAIRLAAAYGILISWTGERGVRCYSSGKSGAATTEWLDRQVAAWSNEKAKLAVANAMFAKRFGEPCGGRSLDQLRGIEGGRVKEIYKITAQANGVQWHGRHYTPGNPDGETDGPNLALNVAATCLYGVAECAILSIGAHPALGFLHHGSQQAFTHDVSDLYKMEIVVPIAMRLVAEKSPDRLSPWKNLEHDVRVACRDTFRRERILEQIVPDIQEVLNAGDCT